LVFLGIYYLWIAGNYYPWITGILIFVYKWMNDIRWWNLDKKFRGAKFKFIYINYSFLIKKKTLHSLHSKQLHMIIKEKNEYHSLS